MERKVLALPYHGRAHVRVDILPLHADANGHTAREGPLRSAPYRWNRFTSLDRSRLACTFLTQAFALHHGYVGASGLPLHRYPQRLIENNNIICLQETRVKFEFLQASLAQYAQFLMVGTFIDG